MSKDNEKFRNAQGTSAQDEAERPRQKADWWDDLEADLLERYEFRFNSILHKPEYREKQGVSWAQVENYTVNTILRRLRTDAKNGKASKTRIEELIYSDFAQRVNPIKEYFASLPDAPGAISRFLELVELANETDRELFVSIFRKWLIATVANVFIEDQCANHVCLVLTGAQGKGKSTMLRSIVPADLRLYYQEGHLNPENKDSLIALAEKFFINLDDSLAGINSKAINELKSIITQGDVDVRRPYERYSIKMPRIASFAACSNEATFLHDATGNRRFAPFELTEINLDAVKAFPVAQLWGEAYHAFIRGEEYWIAGEDLERLAEHNQDYEVQTPEYEAVTKYFQLPRMGGISELLTNGEILAMLERETSAKFSSKKMGEALRKVGFERMKKRRGGNSVYAWNVVRVSGGTGFDVDEPTGQGQDALEGDCPF